MALPRRARKRPVLLPVLIVVAGLCAGLAGPLAAQTAAPVVSDRHTGLAIYGFDPVAYFTDGRAVVGLPDYEFSLDGAHWRFRNPGNRAAFADHPEIYAPRYGGYDPIGLARGVGRPGNPLIFLVSGERLYLFYDETARARFAADPDSAIAAADARWPDVMRAMAP